MAYFFKDDKAMIQVRTIRSYKTMQAGAVAVVDIYDSEMENVNPDNITVLSFQWRVVIGVWEMGQLAGERQPYVLVKRDDNEKAYFEVHLKNSLNQPTNMHYKITYMIDNGN